MQKFDSGAAWNDVKRLLGSHSSLVWSIAGVFIFLPQLLLNFLGPQEDGAAAVGLTTEQQLALVQSNLMQFIPIALIAGIISAIGNAAILRLWLSRTEISVSDALKTGLGLVITIFLIQFLTTIVSAIGLLFLIIPGIYLWTRWSVSAAYAVDMNERNPLTAMQASWGLTKGNVLSIFLFIFVLAIAIGVIVILLSIVSAVFALIPAVGPFLFLVIQSALATVGAVIIVAITAAIYRQLVVIHSAPDYAPPPAVTPPPFN